MAFKSWLCLTLRSGVKLFGTVYAIFAILSFAFTFTNACQGILKQHFHAMFDLLDFVLIIVRSILIIEIATDLFLVSGAHTVRNVENIYF